MAQHVVLSLTLFGVILSGGGARAQDQQLFSASQSSLWQAGVGEGFTRGTQEVGLSLGAGRGLKVFGSRRTHDVALGAVQYGWMLSGVVGADHWYRGNWELLGEFFGGEQFYPEEAYVVGLAPLLRYNFAAGHRCVPFFDLGAGVTATDIRDGDLSTTFEFNLQAGLGARIFLRDDLALTFQFRFIHFSNASTASPNLGANTGAFLAGVTWLF
jgi:lipid A 3-O-deacylase